MFGCGESVGALSPHAPLTPRALDRLRHADELEQPVVASALEARAQGGPGWRGLAGRLGLSGAIGALGALGGRSGLIIPPRAPRGRVHRVPSTEETVRLGVFDATLPNLLEIDPGDVVVYPNTWSHFLNRVQPGVSIESIADLRRAHPGRGPHSIVGPIGVRGAEPGDMLAITFERLEPVDWGASFVNPGELGTGALPDEFPSGQVRYLRIDRARGSAEFLPGVAVPIAPFQGTIGVAPAEGGVASSVPPGRHAGNIDLPDLTEGSTLYVPVWQPSAKLYTGDSHAAQGEGEVCNQALESAMREVRVRVDVHKQSGWTWPMAETADQWLVLGIDPDLNEAFRIAARNTIEFLHRRAGLSRLDAYSLASIGVDFRVTQFVNRTRGVHARVAKALFAPERRAQISIV